MRVLEGKTAIALRFAGEGAAVFLAADGTGAKRGHGAPRRAAPAGGGERDWGTFDFRRSDAAQEMVGKAEIKLGGADILMNNTGIRARRLVGGFSAAEIEQVVAVNRRASFFCQSGGPSPDARWGAGGSFISPATWGSSRPGGRLCTVRRKRG